MPLMPLTVKFEIVVFKNFQTLMTNNLKKIGERRLVTEVECVFPPKSKTQILLSLQSINLSW